MSDEFETEHETDIENNDDTETTQKTGAKRGRKSAAERAALAQAEESQKIHDVEFTTRQAIEDDTAAFRLTCGKCIFYDKLATYGKPCIKRGIVAADIPCKRFQFNTSTLGRKKIPHLVEALAALEESGATLAELAALTISARSAKLRGYNLGQRLWFSISAHEDRQFADTWYDGVVIGGRDGRILVLTDAGAQTLLEPSMLLTEEEFKNIKLKVSPKRSAAIEKIHGLRNIRTMDDEPPKEAKEPRPKRSATAVKKPALRLVGKPKGRDDELRLSASSRKNNSIRLRG